ncbi:hypothetical protein [uncultured Tateyamaria sp.]|uniref:hypothetical protein n=1 Tax=uncultured Tateyamaria sp. TaxID=455651 RepID=UPI00260689A8|nr:hypothetical protein [uncultured Tateyamaria sp.]
MGLFRLLLIVLVTFSAPLSGVAEASHMSMAGHHHAGGEHMPDDHPPCCVDSTERAQSCHILAAVLPAADLHGAAPSARDTVFCAVGVLPDGINPSGPLDPPRAV